MATGNQQTIPDRPSAVYHVPKKVFQNSYQEGIYSKTWAKRGRCNLSNTFSTRPSQIAVAKRNVAKAKAGSWRFQIKKQRPALYFVRMILIIVISIFVILVNILNEHKWTGWIVIQKFAWLSFSEGKSEGTGSQGLWEAAAHGGCEAKRSGGAKSWTVWRLLQKKFKDVCVCVCVFFFFFLWFSKNVRWEMYIFFKVVCSGEWRQR